MKKRNLVVVRAGPSSLHPTWLLAPEERNWDIVVNYFGDDHEQFRRPDVARIDSKGPKWPSLHALLKDGPLEWRSYDYVWLPDDDLAVDGQSINRFFDCCRSFDLDLAQPSLSWDSYVSHLITVYNPSFRVRFSNFVEVMAPCFSARFLERCVDSFALNQTGWGLDFIWPRWAADVQGRCAVIDDVQITHTRPVGGPNYASLAARGLSAQDELTAALRSHDITDIRQICHEGLTVQGENWGLRGTRGDDFVGALCTGWAQFVREKPGQLGMLIREHVEFRTSTTRLRRVVRALVKNV